MISGHDGWGCEWLWLECPHQGKLKVGDKGVVYMQAQQMCGRSFDSAFEERLNKMLLNSVLKANTAQDALNLA